MKDYLKNQSLILLEKMRKAEERAKAIRDGQLLEWEVEAREGVAAN